MRRISWSCCRYNLAREGYRVAGAASGEEAVQTAKAILPDLILLDLLLPGMDGLEVCRSLKGEARTRPIPIIMLSAKGEEADIVAGLELGADDYVTKPFSPRVLLARIRTALRRRAAAPPSASALLKVKELVIDPGRHEVLLEGRRLDLTLMEFHLLQLLARRPGWVYTRGQIVKEDPRGELCRDRALHRCAPGGPKKETRLLWQKFGDRAGHRLPPEGLRHAPQTLDLAALSLLSPGHPALPGGPHLVYRPLLGASSI